jgi:serine/threonine-protein kinase haspin
MMRGPLTRTYGRKKTAGTPAAAAVFGRARESSPLLQGQQSSPLSSQSRQASLRDPLVDITSVVENLSIAGPSELADAGELATVVVENLSIADNASAEEVSELVNVSETTQNEPESIGNDESGVTDPGPTDTADISQDLEPLQDLFDAYRQDCGEPLHMRRWDEVIGGELSISKIAEASFAEVYRVTTEYGSSILKIMQLKLDSDPASLKSYTTVDVKSIVSEMRIMNAMTEIPGFVSFKDAHLVRGKPGTILSDAWSGYLDRSRGSDPDAPMRLTYFPKPDSYSDESVFLVIELGDAGQVLQKAHIDDRDKLFDIFLGITVIMSRAEQEAEFEVSTWHRSTVCWLF